MAQSEHQKTTYPTSTTLIRWAGLASLVAGLGFIIVGLFHPVNVPSMVTTRTWINVHIIAILMCFFGLFGMTGLYVRQIGKIGLLGLVGFVLLVSWMAAVMCFSLVEAFILPGLSSASPQFVEGFLAMFSNGPSTVDLSLLPLIWNISGPAYILGQLLFGIATYRAGILPRFAGALLAVGGLVTPIGGLVPPENQPLVMIPVGISMAWLGYSLWSNRRQV